MTIRYATTADGELPKPEDWKVYDDIDALISEDRHEMTIRRLLMFSSALAAVAINGAGEFRLLPDGGHGPWDLRLMMEGRRL